MTTLDIRGLHTAVITPFEADGKLDVEGLRENLRFQLQNGVDGILALGTTAETPTLTDEEQKQILAVTVEEVKGKGLVLAGTGSNSTEHAIAKTFEAKEAGADAAVVVTPYYNRPTQEGIYRHFKAIAEETGLPIIIYNHPGRTGQNIQTETMKRLAAVPGIIGVKETSGSIAQIQEVIELIARERPGFAVLSGDDPLTYLLMALGGHGVISVVSNIIPSSIRTLVDAMLEGDFAKARDLHFSLLPFFRAAFIEGNPIPIKTMMTLSGMAAGGLRPPLCELQPANLEIVKGYLLEHYRTETMIF